jgi:hypothetical protein
MLLGEMWRETLFKSCKVVAIPSLVRVTILSFDEMANKPKYWVERKVFAFLK